MSKAHDAPRAFHNNDSLWISGSYSMEVVQDLIFGKARWELPLAVLFGETGIDLSSGIANGIAEQIMETHSDTTGEKACPVISAGFKATGRSRFDLLFVQPWG